MEEQIEIEKELQNFDDRTFQFDDDQEIAEDLDLDLVEQEVRKYEATKHKVQSQQHTKSKDHNEPDSKPKQLQKTTSIEKFSSSSKLTSLSDSKDQKASEEHIDEVDDEEAIDEFIKRHLENETPKDGKLQEKSSESDEDSSSQESLTPKQSLLQALLRLSETDSEGRPSAFSTLNERELFIFDLESILKVLTFRETCLLIFPCLEIFAVEQEYLKIELFKQLPNVFIKIMKSDAIING